MESILKSQEDQFAGLLDKLRTWRYENKIVALPALLAVGEVRSSPLGFRGAIDAKGNCRIP